MGHDFSQTPDSPREGGPEVPPRPRQRAKVLPHRPTPPFVLRYHPMRWQLIQTDRGAEWLPLLGTRKLDPGAGGVDKSGDDSLAIVDASRRGWVDLDEYVDGDNYVRRWACEGGWYYCTRWEEPRHIGHRVLASERDDEGYYEFLRFLVREGKVPPPDPAAIELQVDAQQHRLQNLVSESHKPGVAAILDREESRLAAMKEAGAAQAAPKPKRRAARKSKAET